MVFVVLINLDCKEVAAIPTIPSHFCKQLNISLFQYCLGSSKYIEFVDCNVMDIQVL